MSKCPNAKPTDQYHGWECKITGGECMYFFPNYERCKKEYLDDELEDEDDE